MSDANPADELFHPVGDHAAWSESYYFNFVDPTSGVGAFTRMGFRPNDGWADALHAVYLPGGRVVFTYGRRTDLSAMRLRLAPSNSPFWLLPERVRYGAPVGRRSTPRLSPPGCSRPRPAGPARPESLGKSSRAALPPGQKTRADRAQVYS